MSEAKETLVRWLRDAHAMECATVDNLDRIADRLAGHPQLATRLQQHWGESRAQVERIEMNLRRLGADHSTLKDVTTRLLGLAEAYAAALARDEAVKDCLAAFAFEHFEIASYLSLAAAARVIGDTEIERMCEEHLAQERAMAAFLADQIGEVTQDYLRP